MRRRQFMKIAMNGLLLVPARLTKLNWFPMRRKNTFLLNPYFLEVLKPSLLQIAKPSWKINRVVVGGGSKFEQMAAIYAPVSRFTQVAVSAGNRPVIVAGDCCISIAIMAAFQKTKLHPTLIYFDAHGDFNTPETSPSGFTGGMPLAMLMGLGDQTLMRLCGARPLQAANVILTDGRNLDPGEDKAVEISGIYHYNSISELQAHPFGKGPVYVHIDADVINPDDAPAMLYPAKGGPGKKELARVFEFLKTQTDIRAISMGAWEPSLDPAGKTEQVCLELLQDLYS
ncbi:MAG: arginase family protein [Bacteroidota bacterium]|nr:arginase family protein [Bacteroidota bacterium]